MPDAKNYMDNANGLGERRKVRIRMYPGHDTIKLEIKEKTNDLSFKSVLPVSREHALRIIDGERKFLLGYGNAAAERACFLLRGEFLRPVVVCYEPEAFFTPFDSIRITLDVLMRTAR
jgi:hypothetical protein